MSGVMEFTTLKKFEYIRDHKKSKATKVKGKPQYCFTFQNQIIRFAERYRLKIDRFEKFRDQALENNGIFLYISGHTTIYTKTGDGYLITYELPLFCRVEGNFRIPWTHCKDFKTAIKKTNTEEIDKLFDLVARFDKASEELAAKFPKFAIFQKSVSIWGVFFLIGHDTFFIFFCFPDKFTKDIQKLNFIIKQHTKEKNGTNASNSIDFLMHLCYLLRIKLNIFKKAFS